MTHFHGRLAIEISYLYFYKQYVLTACQLDALRHYRAQWHVRKAHPIERQLGKFILGLLTFAYKCIKMHIIAFKKHCVNVCYRT